MLVTVMMQRIYVYTATHLPLKSRGITMTAATGKLQVEKHILRFNVQQNMSNSRTGIRTPAWPQTVGVHDLAKAIKIV